MSIAALIDQLTAQGLQLWFEGERLRFRGPRDVLTDAHRQRLRAERESVLAELRARAAASSHALALDRRVYSTEEGHRVWCFAARATADVDAAALRQALQAIVDRHEALRLRVDDSGGEPVLRVHGWQAATLEFDEGPLADAVLQARLADAVRAVTDPAGLPWHLSIHRCLAGRQVMLFAISGQICDRISLCRLIDELRQFYAEAIGAPCVLPGRVEVSFSDWFAEVPPAARVAVDSGAAAMADLAGQRQIVMQLAPGLGEALSRFADERNCPTEAVLLAAWLEAWQRSGRAPAPGWLFARDDAGGRKVRTVGPLTVARFCEGKRGATGLAAAAEHIATTWRSGDRRSVECCGGDWSIETYELDGVSSEIDDFLRHDGSRNQLGFGSLELEAWPLPPTETGPAIRLQLRRRGREIDCLCMADRTACTEESLRQLCDSLHEVLIRDVAAAEVPSLSVEPIATPSSLSLDALLSQLRRLGVQLSVDGGRLRVNAPKGVLDDALKAELSRCKEGIVAALAGSDPGRCDEAIPAVERSGLLPLSHQQQRLWFLRQMEPDNAAYNIPFAIRMGGRLDEDALERSLAALIRRHESLRTRFVAVEGEPACAIEAQVPFELKRIDLSHLAQLQREDASRRAVREFVAMPFSIGRAPLLRAALIHLDVSDHLFCVVIDHLVADGLSMGIFVGEFRTLYAEYATGEPAVLAPLAVQYADYAQWQRRELDGGALSAQLDFWKGQLAGLPSALQLPTDRPRPPVQTYRGARLIHTLPAGLGERLRTFGRSVGATQFMVLLAAFQVLLHRYSGMSDIPVGTSVANRNHDAIEGVIGFFANNIVLRGDLEGRPTVLELLRRVRQRCLDAMSHDEVPFDLLVDALGTRREIDHAPLFQVMFMVLNMEAPRLDLPGLACEALDLGSDWSRFDLSVDVFDMPDGMKVAFEFNTDLFDRTTIERMMRHFRVLLDGLIARPDSRIDELPLLAEDELRQMLVDWNRTAAPYADGVTVHGLFEAQAARTPDAIALEFEQATLSYAELNRRANQLAHRLRRMGVGMESLVGVWLERSIEMVVALLGALKAGAAYVPLDPAFPQERLAYMAEDATLAVVLTQRRLATAVGAGALPVLCLDDANLEDETDCNPTPFVTGLNLAYVIYTSGSTGQPKGVQLEHRGLVNFLRSMQREPGIGPADRMVAVTTLSFDIAGLEIFGPLTAGATAVLASRATALDGLLLAELLERSEATLLQATPATWRLLLDSGWRGRPTMRMLCGGEALPRDLAERLLPLGKELWNLYGPTETTIWSTLTRVTDTTRPITIGRPIANTEVYVIEPSGLPAPVGVAGELCIGGDGLARGYRNREDLTAASFMEIELPLVGVRRVYRTGDLARYLADGRIEFIGRRDHQVKIRGFRIELGEVESVLAKVAGVRECVVQVREDRPGDQRLIGYVVASPHAGFDADAARAGLRRMLPEYMVPNLFVMLETLPLTPNGKVDRKALPAPSFPGAEARPDVLMTPLEARIAGLWRQVLGTDWVGLHDNFFELGGHSLLLVKLQAALKREFGGELPLVELFQRTTVAAQAERYAAPMAADDAIKRAQARAARQLHG